MEESILINDPANMKIARDASWICRLFQSYYLDCSEKQMIIRKLLKEFKERKKKYGQGNKEREEIH